MRKGLFKTLLLAFAVLLLFGTKKAFAGHEVGTVSKDNPCVYARFTLSKGDEFYGILFDVKGKAAGAKLNITNLSKGDVSLKATVYDIKDDKFDELKSIDLKKGKKQATLSLDDFKNGDKFFVQISEANCYDLSEMTIGISVYSEALGGAKHDFTKIVLSKDEVDLKVGKTTTIKVKSIDKALKKEGVIWTSSDKKVATVSKNGKVKAKKEGCAIITCTSKKNRKITAQCVIWASKKGPSVVNDDKDIAQSGNISDVKIMEEAFGFDTARRTFYIETNGYSGSLDIEIKCDNGTDTQTVKVEKNKKYRIDYDYDFTNRDDNWASILSGGGQLSLNTKVLSVSIKGEGGDYSGWSKLTANIFNIGSLSMYEE